MLVIQNSRFRKNKTCLQKKKGYLRPPSRHGHFHSILILLEKMVELPQQHANPLVVNTSDEALSNTCYHCQLLQRAHLNMAEFLDPSLKSWLCTKNSLVSSENQSFFLLFRNMTFFIESHCVFLIFLQDNKVSLISLLDCYHYLFFMDLDSDY